jgi:hypothetical protein
LTSGNSATVPEGIALSRAINDIILDEYPELFGDAALEVFAEPGVTPLGGVNLELFFFVGCVPSEVVP